MSFEEFEKRTANHPGVGSKAAELAADDNRRAFHEAWLREVYPHWQGPLVSISKRSGVESATYSVTNGLSSWKNGAEVLRALGRDDWLVTEVIAVTTAVGVQVAVTYAFAGDPNDGAMLRLAGYSDGGLVAVSDTGRLTKGPKAALMAVAEADLTEAVEVLGTMLVTALDAREARALAERETAERAERERAEAEASAGAAAAKAPTAEPDEPAA